MTDPDTPLRIAITATDPALAARLRAALAGVAGLQLVTNAGEADAVLTGRAVPPRADPLTPREHEVLALLAEGASNKVIARRLGISVHTAKFHVRRVTDKFDAVGRTDAVAQAARLRLIEL